MLKNYQTMTKNDGDLKCILLSEIFQFDCMISIICHFGKMQNYGDNKKSMIFPPVINGGGMYMLLQQWIPIINISCNSVNAHQKWFLIWTMDPRWQCELINCNKCGTPVLIMRKRMHTQGQVCMSLLFSRMFCDHKTSLK